MDLSMEIVKNLRDKLNNNFMFSPLSMKILLSIVACGLKPGPDLDRLLSLLRFKSLADLKAQVARHEKKLRVIFESMPCEDDEESPTLSSINGSWVDKKFTLNPSFLHVLQTLYRAESFTLDFENKTKEAVDEINSWGEKATKGLINKFIKHDKNMKDTALILANALYFKAFWYDPFDESNTRSENFYTLNGDIVQVPYLCMRNPDASYASSNGFKVLTLSYSSRAWISSFSMYFFLPDDKDGLLNLLDQLSSNPNLLKLKFEFQHVEVTNLMVPKFKFKCRFEVSKIMERLGLSMSVDLSGMLEGLGHEETPFKMKILQSCSINVDEYGTEATVVTDAEPNMTMSMYTPPRVDFIADHPFVFLIREENSKTTLFLGAVVNPLNKQP